MPVQAHGARQCARSQCVYMQKVVGAKRPGARQRARSSSGSVYKVDGTIQFGARQRPRSCAFLSSGRHTPCIGVNSRRSKSGCMGVRF